MMAYMYQAELHCRECVKTLGVDDHPPHIAEDAGIDSDDAAIGPYFIGYGETGIADTPQHCGTCGTFLENPLTDDGREYVLDAILRADGNPEVLQEWREFYRDTLTREPEALPESVTVEHCGCCEFEHRSDEFADCRADWFGLMTADSYDKVPTQYVDANGEEWISRQWVNAWTAD